MTEKRKANVQAIKDIVRMNQVWEQEKGEQGAAELHYYHIVDALQRKWQTSVSMFRTRLRFLKEGITMHGHGLLSQLLGTLI
ncbi:hypothetical protein [Paenibacillus terrae]|uniref:hypothetical protein n=1 Tax=Paenibacillus terrae TaxID=159743 RepID=UPI0021CCF00A|nr:hypothetical protein [Paenibacillus terrae]